MSADELSLGEDVRQPWVGSFSCEGLPPGKVEVHLRTYPPENRSWLPAMPGDRYLPPFQSVAMKYCAARSSFVRYDSTDVPLNPVASHAIHRPKREFQVYGTSFFEITKSCFNKSDLDSVSKKTI